MWDVKDLLIVALLVAAGVLGYLYYQNQQHALSVKAPGFALEGK